MPILEAFKARQMLVNRRSMASGCAGLDNKFYMDSTVMVFDGAKEVIEEIGEAG